MENGCGAPSPISRNSAEPPRKTRINRQEAQANPHRAFRFIRTFIPNVRIHHALWRSTGSQEADSSGFGRATISPG